MFQSPYSAFPDTIFTNSLRIETITKNADQRRGRHRQDFCETDLIVGGVFRALMNLPLFKSALRPITRVLVGLIAIPLFRFIMRKIFRLQDLDDELEKDLEEWFRGALLLLAASANMEHLLFGWMAKVDWLDRADWLTMGLRLMLAIGVIEAMPEQELFAVIHRGPPKLKAGRSTLIQAWRLKWRIIKGALCQHLNRSSPVLAMMCAIVGAQLPSIVDHKEDVIHEQYVVSWVYSQQASAIGPANLVMSLDALHEIEPDLAKAKNEYTRQWERWLVGWCCYLLAITQYLIIGLVTSRDRALDVLTEFDRAVAERRREIIEEFQLENGESAQQAPAPDCPLNPPPTPSDSESTG
ncbi:MAG: hypothetical protein KDA85_19090 [Planctomycetaceae bacterium]|nr:hypothetical protein [Planctomycetaceae bacterium]